MPTTNYNENKDGAFSAPETLAERTMFQVTSGTALLSLNNVPENKIDGIVLQEGDIATLDAGNVVRWAAEDPREILVVNRQSVV